MPSTPTVTGQHQISARPGQGARWKVTTDLSVRFVHNTVDGATHLRAIDIATKKTVFKLKNQPGSRRCPSTPVLNQLLTVIASTDARLAPLTERCVTLTERAPGKFAVVLSGKLNGTRTEIPDIVDDEAGLVPLHISGYDGGETRRVLNALTAHVELMASPDASPDQLVAAQAHFAAH